MAKIIFDYTPASHYSAQGAGPSGKEGYDIWLEGMHWLGYIPLDEFEQWVYHYQQRGNRVYLRDKRND